MPVDSSIGLKEALIRELDAVKVSGTISHFTTSSLCMIQPARKIYHKNWLEKTYLVRKHLQLFMWNLSYCKKWNFELGTANSQRLFGMFPKGLFGSSNICSTYFKMARSGSMAQRPAFLKFLTPLPPRTCIKSWMFIFPRVPPYNGGDRLRFDKFFHTHCILLHRLCEIENILFRDIFRNLPFYSTAVQSIAWQNDLSIIKLHMRCNFAKMKINMVPIKHEKWWIFTTQFIFSTSSNLQNIFGQTNLKELFFHSEWSGSIQLNLLLFLFLQNRSKTLRTSCTGG